MSDSLANGSLINKLQVLARPKYSVNKVCRRITKEKKAKLEEQLEEIAQEVDDERQISKIIAITRSHSGYRPEKEKLLPWEKFHSNHRHLAMNLLNRTRRWARAWST